MLSKDVTFTGYQLPQKVYVDGGNYPPAFCYLPLPAQSFRIARQELGVVEDAGEADACVSTACGVPACVKVPK